MKRGGALKRWFTNMVTHHQFTPHEVRAATGISLAEVKKKIEDWKIAATAPARAADAPLKVLPFPGGRHPRIGFLDGALTPQRETKVSVFTPWNPHHYVVVVVPEALWSNLGLTYLAHTHIRTVWDLLNKKLPPLEWKLNADGSLSMQRTLPNGIAFGSTVIPQKDVVKMKMWIRNGSPNELTKLRAQMCVMLKSAPEFNQRIAANKIKIGNWAACRDAEGKRWIITGWEPIHRPWENPPVPCLHADPSFPDCLPGKTVQAKGIIAFHVGKGIRQQIAKLKALYLNRR